MVFVHFIGRGVVASFPVLLVAIAIAGCGSTPGRTGGPAGTPSASAPAGQPVASGSRTGGSQGGQSTATLSGPISGQLSSDATASCGILDAGGSSGKEYSAELIGTVNGQKADISITVRTQYKGPGQYPVGGVVAGAGWVQMKVGAVNGDTADDAGTLTVNPDEKTGTIDAKLVNGDPPLGSDDAEHLQATWSCSKVDH